MNYLNVLWFTPKSSNPFILQYLPFCTSCINKEKTPSSRGMITIGSVATSAMKKYYEMTNVHLIGDVSFAQKPRCCLSRIRETDTTDFASFVTVKWCERCCRWYKKKFVRDNVSINYITTGVS